MLRCDGNSFRWGLLTVTVPPYLCCISGFHVDMRDPRRTVFNHDAWREPVTITSATTVTLDEFYGLGLSPTLVDDAIGRILDA